MEDVGITAYLARGRAEIKSRLLSSASLPPPQTPDYRGNSAGELPSHAEAHHAEDKSAALEQSELDGTSAVGNGTFTAGNDEAAEPSQDEVKWIEPVFIEPVSADDAMAGEEPR